jgi:hypothetical protein
MDPSLRSYFPGVEEVTNDCSGVSDARYERVVLYLM